MITADKWKHFGQAGHFIAADRCRFHLHTHVGRFCVSTVGDYHPTGIPSDPEDGKPREIGCGRLFETMVFPLTDKGNVEEWGGIDADAYNDRDAANAGRLAMVVKYAELQP